VPSSAFPPHGKYRLHWRGDILCLEFHATWNLEAVQDFIAAVQHTVAERAPARWGRLADMRRWKGATPEATQAYTEFSSWYAAAGAVAHAQLYPSKLMQRMADPVNVLVAQSGPVRQCRSFDEALAWLREFDLATEDTE
jgi:hypothetical protein